MPIEHTIQHMCVIICSHTCTKEHMDTHINNHNHIRTWQKPMLMMLIDLSATQGHRG